MSSTMYYVAGLVEGERREYRWLKRMRDREDDGTRKQSWKPHARNKISVAWGIFKTPKYRKETKLSPGVMILSQVARVVFQTVNAQT